MSSVDTINLGGKFDVGKYEMKNFAFKVMSIN